MTRESSPPRARNSDIIHDWFPRLRHRLPLLIAFRYCGSWYPDLIFPLSLAVRLDLLTRCVAGA